MQHHHKRNQRHQRKCRGATMVEFAICLPVLLAIVFGMLEFARITQLQHTARLAAFEGARAGVTLDASASDVNSEVNRVMSAVGILTFTTTITPANLAYTSPTVTVNVSVPAKANSWFTWFVTSSSTTITASITLGREVQAVSAP